LRRIAPRLQVGEGARLDDGAEELLGGRLGLLAVEQLLPRLGAPAVHAADREQRVELVEDDGAEGAQRLAARRAEDLAAVQRVEHLGRRAHDRRRVEQRLRRRRAPDRHDLHRGRRRQQRRRLVRQLHAQLARRRHDEQLAPRAAEPEECGQQEREALARPRLGVQEQRLARQRAADRALLDRRRRRDAAPRERVDDAGRERRDELGEGGRRRCCPRRRGRRLQAQEDSEERRHGHHQQSFA